MFIIVGEYVGIYCIIYLRYLGRYLPIPNLNSFKFLEVCFPSHWYDNGFKNFSFMILRNV